MLIAVVVDAVVCTEACFVVAHLIVHHLVVHVATTTVRVLLLHLIIKGAGVWQCLGPFWGGRRARPPAAAGTSATGTAANTALRRLPPATHFRGAIVG